MSRHAPDCTAHAVNAECWARPNAAASRNRPQPPPPTGSDSKIAPAHMTTPEREPRASVSTVTRARLETGARYATETARGSIRYRGSTGARRTWFRAKVLVLPSESRRVRLRSSEFLTSHSSQKPSLNETHPRDDSALKRAMPVRFSPPGRPSRCSHAPSR